MDNVIQLPIPGTQEYDNLKMKKYLRRAGTNMPKEEYNMLMVAWDMSKAGLAKITWDAAGEPLFQASTGRGPEEDDDGWDDEADDEDLDDSDTYDTEERD